MGVIGGVDILMCRLEQENSGSAHREITGNPVGQFD